MKSSSSCWYLVVAGIFEVLSIRSAGAAQAAPTDLTDFIARMGGWFYPIDGGKYNDPKAQYWAQMTYSTALAGSNTTITMTRYNEQRQDPKGGAPCSTDNVVTDTVVIDTRELQTKTTSREMQEGPIAVWAVTLYTNGGKHLIRVRTISSPPTISVSSPSTASPGAAATAPGTTSSAGNGVQSGTPASPPAAPACPALRSGVKVVASTKQTDESSYAIEFSGEEQAKYFQMLVASAVPNMNPPRPTLAAPIP